METTVLAEVAPLKMWSLNQLQPFIDVYRRNHSQSSEIASAKPE